MHRREGEPCPRCGSTIRKLRAAGRGTYVCPRCQPAARVRRPPRSPTCKGDGRNLQDRGRGAAIDPLRRGRPRAAPLQRRPRTGRGGGQGSAADALAPGRAARADGARPARAARRPRRALHRDRGRHRPRPPRAAGAAASLERGVQACEAVLRLLDSAEPNRAAYNLLCNQLGPARLARRRPPRGRSRWPSARSCCWRRALRRSWPRAPPAASAST